MTQVTNEQLAGMIATGFEEAALDRARIESEARSERARIENKVDNGFEEAARERSRIEEKVDALSDVTLKNIKKRLTRVENDVHKLKYSN